jgi:hypothetical protein
VLGKVGGEMMITDLWVTGLLSPPRWVEYGVMAFFVAFVCLLSKWIGNRRKSCILKQADLVADGIG